MRTRITKYAALSFVLCVAALAARNAETAVARPMETEHVWPGAKVLRRAKVRNCLVFRTLLKNADAKLSPRAIWVVFKTHFDIGFTDTIAQVLARYRGPMIDNAMAVIAKNRTSPSGQRFSWTVPGWPLTRIIDQQQTADRRAKVLEALKEGLLARGHYAKWLQTYVDKGDEIRKADTIVLGALTARLELLARSVKFEGPRVVVYNPLPWPRSGLARIAGTADGTVKDVASGNVGLCIHGCFLARDVPAHGYRTYVFSTEATGKEERSAAATLDTPWFTVSFDLQRGGIASLDFTPKRPAVFVNLYNNMWNTSFRLWQEGSWSERITLWPLRKGTDVVEDLVEKAWEARLPLLTAAVRGLAGTLPLSQPGLALSRRGVLVTAFGNDPDGNAGTLLRVWEQSGRAGDLTVTLPHGLKATSAAPVDLRGGPRGKALAIVDGTSTFPLPAFAPASFVLTDESRR